MKLTTTKLMAAAIAAVLIVAAFVAVPGLIRAVFTQKTEIRVLKGQGAAAIEAGAAAMATVSDVAAKDAAADQILKEGIDAIRAAPEGSRGAAAVDASCRLRLYADSERCARLRTPGSGEPAGAGRGRGAAGADQAR